MRTLLLLVLPFHFCLPLFAQMAPTCLPGQKPADKCPDACVYCDINGYVGSTVGYTGPHDVQCGCIYVDNDQWLGFVAGDTMADFTVTCISCVNGNGVQIGIYESCTSGAIDCDCGTMGGNDVPVHLNNIPLTPGATYFLMIDGFANDKCSFTVTVDPPTAALANPLGTSIGAIQGPDVICPGATVTYTVPHVSNAGSYTWTAPPGWLINGHASPQQLFTIDGGNSIQVKVGNNNGQICVQAANSCFPDGPSTCKSIVVAPLPENNLPPAYVCHEDKPYTLPWGGTVSNSGTYQKILKSYLGCDSLVRQQVIIKPPLVTNLPPTTICAGAPMMVCGVPYTTPGNYSVKCQSHQGCDSLVNFSLSVLSHTAQINGGNTLTCSQPSALLTANPSAAGTLFQWKNSSGLNFGDSTHLLVTIPDTYILTATLDGSGIQCIKADTINIPADTLSPTVTANGGTLNCTVNTLQINALTNANTPFWHWDGPGVFSATIPNPMADRAGSYSVTVTDGNNGCTASATTTVVRDTTPPTVSTSGATLTCAITSALISANVLPASVQYQWFGPNGFMSNLPAPMISAAGTYTVTVTDPANHCNTIDTTLVMLNNTPPGANALAGGSISCTTPTINLQGGPFNGSNTYSWTGPGSEHFSGQNPEVSLSGNYTLIVTGANGCTSETTVSVTGDTLSPHVNAIGGTVSCGVPTIALQGSSNTAGASFEWTGPNGFTALLQNPSASDTGTYTMTVTGPNACTAATTALVAGDFILPDISATADTITCFHPDIPIFGSSTTPGTTFEWHGPAGFYAAQAMASTNIGGAYTLTATAPNGCFNQTSLVVPVDMAAPDAVAESDIITCNQPNIHLMGVSNQLQVLWSWTGPGSFTSNEQAPVIQTAGLYQLEVTSLGNGCTAFATTLVAIDQIAPVAISNTGTLTCAQDSLMLFGQSSVASSFTWTGPGGFHFSGPNPIVSTPGDYTLIAQGIVNGCTDTIFVTVGQDVATPDASAIGGMLDCNTALTALTGASTTTNAAFFWTGPNGFSATIQNPEVADPGLYTLTVTGQNGCQSTTTATVLENTDAPVVFLQGNDTLTCTVSAVTLDAIISTNGASGVWTGPNNFSATTPIITISISGDYVYTVTAPNGCVAAPSISVLQDIAPPALAGTQGGLLNCAIQSIPIQALSSGNVGYHWSGPGAFDSNAAAPTVALPGIYQVTVTNLDNGCTVTGVAGVTQDLSTPDIAVQSDWLTCTTTTVVLEATTNSSVSTFNWTGPNNFHSQLEDPITNAPGDYYLVVTGANGCTASFAHSVNQDITAPEVGASGDTLTCLHPLGQITSFSPAPAAAYAWTGPGGFNVSQASAMVQEGGMYTVVVTGSNGCSSSAQVTVALDMEAPILDVGGGIINCLDTTVMLSAMANADVTWHWSGPNQFNSSLQQPMVSIPGNYVVTITAENGCTSTAVSLVEDQRQSPEIQINPPDNLDCITTEVTLSASVIGPGQYILQWVTNNGIILSGAETPQATVAEAGEYVLQVTDLVNGCTAAQQTTVVNDPSMPSGMVLAKRNISCYGETDGSVKISSIVGGVPPFLYSIDYQAFTTSNYYGSLPEGTHSLVVKDANGCEYETAFLIEALPPVLIDLGPDTTIHLGQSVVISLESAINYPNRVAEVHISPQDLLLPDTLTPLNSFQYHVELVDSNGCRVRDSRFIIVDKERWVYIPNVFNPGGNNPQFTVFGGEDVQMVRSFQVFDRWGNAVFERRLFEPNDPSLGWNGTFDGTALTPAVFVYYAEVLFLDGEILVYKGDVTLIR